jgi:hypothetical protein
MTSVTIVSQAAAPGRRAIFRGQRKRSALGNVLGIGLLNTSPE